MWFRHLSIALACVGTLAACANGDNGAAGNTELNVIVPNGYDAGSSAPALIDIQDVEYTVDCAGNSDTFLDNNSSFPDEVTLNGNLEVQDGRTNPLAIYGDPAIDGQAEIWQGLMDLPPGPCTIELRARDNDGEVICTAQEPFNIAADSLTKVNIVLICDISFQAPVGMLDLDGTFSFNVGNFCPDLFILNCLDSIPAEQQILPPPFPPVSLTTCEVRFRDGDSTCGAGCDPQACVPNGTSGLTCTPGPDPGVSTTITCTNLQIDCDFNPITTETECTFTGDTLGALGVSPPNTPGAGAFAVICIPPALGGIPGAVGECTAVTTDGDLDCDKTKVVTVQCVGETPCWLYGVDQGLPGDGDAACQAAAGTACVTSICDDSLALGGNCLGGICCVDTLVPDGTDCSAENPPLAACFGGVCSGVCCTDDAGCNDGNPCTTNTCNVGSCLCEATNTASGTACDAGAGASSGACDGAGACVDICTFNPACPDPGVECQVADCNPADGTCGSQAGPDGTTCDFSGPGSADGFCSGGFCNPSGEPCNFIMTGTDLPQTQVVPVGCTGNVTSAQSPLPFILSVDVPTPIFGGAAFTAGLDGVGFFPEFFLDAAQGVVCGGLRTAQLVDFVATVQVRSGATGADVPLLIDLGTLSPGPTSFCNFPSEQTCTVGTDCLGGICNPPILLQDLPVLDGTPLVPNGCDADTSLCPIPGPPDPAECDCSPCNALGGAKIAQCADNGFCQNGSLVLQMQSAIGNYVAEATGPVLWGWADQGVPGLSICPVGSDCGVVPGRVDGCYQLPTASFADPVPPIGIRVNAGGLAVPIQCAMAEDGGTCSTTATQGCLVDADCPGAETCVGVGVDDDVVCPTPDANLISCPVL